MHCTLYSTLYTCTTRKYDAQVGENTAMAMSSSNSKPPSKHSMFDLEKQYIFYASYHSNPVNLLIHLLCIWNTAASGLVFFQYTPSLAPMPSIVEQGGNSIETFWA